MTEVLVFHHALGLTPGVTAFADELRNAGHTVATPDLFDGAMFGSVADGVAHAEQLGFDTVIDRGALAADSLTNRFAVVGFSLGVLPAQRLAQTRPGVIGAVLCHSAVPTSAFSETGWPADVAVQFHFAEHDPWAEEDLPIAREIASQTGGELYLYPGSGHLIADSSFADYDHESARLILQRTLTILDIRR